MWYFNFFAVDEQEYQGLREPLQESIDLFESETH